MQKFYKLLEDKWQLVLTLMFSLVVILLMLFVNSLFKNDANNAPVDNELLEQLLAETESADADEESSERIAQAHEEPIVKEVVEQQIIVVDVKGAVGTPGVYQMENTDRVIDAIEMAGGFLPEANLDVINLAQILNDQMVIYIPTEGEELTDVPPLANDVPQTAAESDGNLGPSKVNINTADREELKKLHGIGDSKAESILSYREEYGSFQSIEEIKNVSGIGEATYEKLKEFIVVKP